LPRAAPMLLYYLHRLIEFREQDLEAVAELHGLDAAQLNQRTLPGDPSWSPFRDADFPSVQAAVDIAQRALLLRVRPAGPAHAACALGRRACIAPPHAPGGGGWRDWRGREGEVDGRCVGRAGCVCARERVWL